MTDTSGAAVERYVYDPYGKVTIYDDDWSDTVSWANSEQNEILYCGYRFDPESALYHVRNRMYDYSLGRWLQRDPKGYVDGMDLYLYCGDCPLSRLDAMGLGEKSLLGVVWGEFCSTFTHNESPTARRKRQAQEFAKVEPEPLVVMIVDPNASKVTQLQQKIAAVPVAGNLTSAYNEHAYRHNDAAAQDYLWAAAADSLNVAGSAAGGAAQGVRSISALARGAANAEPVAAGVTRVKPADVQAATNRAATQVGKGSIRSPAVNPVETANALNQGGVAAKNAANTAVRTAGEGAGAAPKGASTPPVNELPSSGNKFVVDPKGNTIVVKPGETVTSSPDGKWVQVRGPDGTPTGTRLDGGHKPASHPDPRAQQPHAHVPGVTNPDGTPWLPVKE